MKTIKINLKTHTPLSEEYLINLFLSFKGSKYNVYIDIFDYSLVKDLYNNLEKAAVYSPVNVKAVLIHDMPFEDKEKWKDDLIKNTVENCFGFDGVVNISSESAFKRGWLDYIDLSVFDDPRIGSIYSDYESSFNGNSIRIHQRSQPIMNGFVPLLILSPTKIKEVYNQIKENTDIAVFQNFIAKHVPEVLLSIEANVKTH